MPDGISEFASKQKISYWEVKGYEKKNISNVDSNFRSMVLGLAACGATDTKDRSRDASAAGSGSSGDLIKVGIINNDPNESGYRTANDKDMKNMFTKENGYDASFAYSLKNDEQITAAQKFIQDGVDYFTSFHKQHPHPDLPAQSGYHRNRLQIPHWSGSASHVHFATDQAASHDKSFPSVRHELWYLKY